VVAGWIADGAGYSVSFGVSALVLAVPTLAVLAAPETLRRVAPEPLSAAASEIT
jgi:hypothetical protein